MAVIYRKALVFIFLVNIVIFSFCTSTFAKRPSVPPEINNIFSEKYLVGYATLRYFGFTVYDIALWSEKLPFSYDNPFAITISYKLPFSSEDLSERSIEEMRRNYVVTKLEENFYNKQMLRVFRDIKRGDSKTAVFFPGQGLSMYHNSEFSGTVEDIIFARRFVDIWLHPNSSYPKVTNKILGKVR